MSNALFKQVLQISFVVRDLDEAVRKYWDVCGVGPWSFYTMDKSNMRDTKLNGREAQFSMKIAITDLKGFQLELIEPLDDENIYAQFLREHGEGMHHIAYATDDFDEAITVLREKGVAVLQEGTTDTGIRFAYLDTRKVTACITEIYKMPTDFVFPEPEKTYP